MFFICGKDTLLKPNSQYKFLSQDIWTNDLNFIAQHVSKTKFP